jgi:hypothetical protein
MNYEQKKRILLFIVHCLTFIVITIRASLPLPEDEGLFLVYSEGANKILEFILQICGRIHKIENDGTN